MTGRKARPRIPSPAPVLRPALEFWVREQGWIELGRAEGSSAFIQALDAGGLVWEGAPSYPSSDAALQEVETALAAWLDANISGWRVRSS